MCSEPNLPFPLCSHLQSTVPLHMCVDVSVSLPFLINLFNSLIKTSCMKTLFNFTGSLYYNFIKLMFCGQW